MHTIDELKHGSPPLMGATRALKEDISGSVKTGRGKGHDTIEVLVIVSEPNVKLRRELKTLKLVIVNKDIVIAKELIHANLLQSERPLLQRRVIQKGLKQIHE
jgi:hypothetical protein